MWCPDDGECHEDARKIEACFPDDAAEKWAERFDWDSAEYTIANGTEKTVNVKEITGSEILRYEVYAETNPRYYARRVKEAA